MASTLDEKKGLAFSDFINKYSLKTCAVLKKEGNFYSVENSIGFDAESIITSTSTTDFWQGICNKPGIIKLFEKADNSINTLLQLFSQPIKESLNELYIVKNENERILISEQEISKKCSDDFFDICKEKHICHVDKLNPLIHDGSFVLKFKINPSEAVNNFLSEEQNTKVSQETLKQALINEIYNRFICLYNKADASILAADNSIKTVFIADRTYSVELIINHILLNLKEVLSDSAKLIKIDFLGNAESYAETKEFLQAE